MHGFWVCARTSKNTFPQTTVRTQCCFLSLVFSPSAQLCFSSVTNTSRAIHRTQHQLRVKLYHISCFSTNLARHKICFVRHFRSRSSTNNFFTSHVVIAEDISRPEAALTCQTSINLLCLPFRPYMAYLLVQKKRTQTRVLQFPVQFDGLYFQLINQLI